MKTLYADIALPVPVDKTFTYIVPPELHESSHVGCRALVPFGRRHLVGYVVAISETSSRPNLKPLRDVVDSEPTMSEELLRLTRWVSDYYFAPWGEALKAAAPRGFSLEGRRKVRLREERGGGAVLPGEKRPKRQQEILNHLSRAGEMTIASLQKKLGTRSVYAHLNAMTREGLLTVDEEIPFPRVKPKRQKVVLFPDGRQHRWEEAAKRLAGRSKKQAELLEKLTRLAVHGRDSMPLQEVLTLTGSSLTVLSRLAKQGLVQLEGREIERSSAYDDFEEFRSIVLNGYQKSVLSEIQDSISRGVFCAFLLHGVTGSGKTQVYIEAIRSVLDRGKTAIVLVPEISLTGQIIRRFRAHFPDDVAVLHSRMSEGERYDAWRLVHRGKYRIVIGARSAVFAPLNNLGLIVVDEEQEASFKQFDATPRYHARDVALVRANYCGAVVILGSATPSLESYYNAQTGKYRLLELPTRVDQAKLPRIQVVDMIAERKRTYVPGHASQTAEQRNMEAKSGEVRGSLSALLREKIEDRLRKREGIILLQNRRGFAPYLECLDCGYVGRCSDCSVTLTYHMVRKQMRCHYCGSVQPVPVQCPQCAGRALKVRGYGTQRVEEELKLAFPEARILRMDLDTTTRKGSHERLLKTFIQRHADILMGTQMVAKGLDISHVTLVGVISADTQMLLPDFRSAERTFQLLTQVAGRAGRRVTEGEVIIQTSQPQHYSFKYVLDHNFRGFYEDEVEWRRELRYPPFGRLVLVEFKGPDENDVEQGLVLFDRVLGHVGREIEKLGPAPAAISKIRKLYRYHLLLKASREADPSGTLVHRALRKALGRFKVPSGSQLTIDVDPQGML